MPGKSDTDVRELGQAARRLAAQCEGGMPPADVCVGEGGWAVPRAFLRYRDAIRNMEVRPTDVWVLSYPKCGTTWTQEMTWIVGNQCNLQAAKDTPIDVRFPFLEYTAFCPESTKLDTMEMVNNMPQDKPRFIKSHLPIELLPKNLFLVKPKIVYVSRDPRDVILSFEHHYRLFNGFEGSTDDFLDAFLEDGVSWSPFWRHNLEFWEKRHTDNFLFIRYEDMKKDLRLHLHQVADLLGQSIPASLEDAVLDHLSFSSMKNNTSVNYQDDVTRRNKAKDPGSGFMRKGEAGSWKRALSADQISRLDEWSEKWLRGTQYPYSSPA